MLEQTFINFGYTKEEYNEIRNSYSLKNYFEEKLLEKFKENTTYLLELGYTKEEVIKMTKSLPAIYGLSIENMKQKLTDVMSLGYTKEEDIKMTKTLPAINGYSIENMKQKIEFYDSINMHFLAVQDSTKLMQSVALSYAGYQFYLSIGIIIDMRNYKKLFIGNKSFEKTYGITKEELLVRYPYEQYTEEKNNGRTI